MNPKVVTPQEAHAMLTANAAAVYIDVRTVAEFATGHPRGKVVNIPIIFNHPTTKEIFPNDSFLLVAEDLYAKDTPLLVGSDTGERAEQAVGKLLEAGYTDVSVMQEGFPGWRALKLPTTTDNRDGISYVSLLTRVKRKGKKKAVHA
jgi:rhodanese-related sulfurtransferase